MLYTSLVSSVHTIIVHYYTITKFPAYGALNPNMIPSSSQVNAVPGAAGIGPENVTLISMVCASSGTSMQFLSLYP